MGNSRPLKVWAHRDKHGNISAHEFCSHELTEFWGMSEEGVITDAYGGGCVTEPLSSFGIEDLVMLHKWAQKHFAQQPAPAPSLA